jgi:uncharacterized protein (UPF0335 family)
MTDTTELVRRLRKVAVAAERPDGTDCPLSEQLKEVSDRLEALEAENKRLRAVVKHLVDWWERYPFASDVPKEIIEIARAALKGDQP